MRTAILSGLLVLAWPFSATAIDCPSWRLLDLAARTGEVGRMISDHLDSHTSQKYTSENKVVIQRCLKNFAPQIVEEIDQACTDRSGASAKYIDDLFDRYLLSCI